MTTPKHIRLAIQGREPLDLHCALFDFNGTLAVDGILHDNVREYLRKLSEFLSVHVATADTFGTAPKQLENLPLALHVIRSGQEKLALLRNLGARTSVAVGNGLNDVAMLEAAGLSICVIGAEGAAALALHASSLVTSSIESAFELLLHPDRIKAGLRE